MEDDRKTQTFLKFHFYTTESLRIALLVKNPSGKILYLCILIPQSEYIRICHWETFFLFCYFKITEIHRKRHGLGNNRYHEILGLVVYIQSSDL